MSQATDFDIVGSYNNEIYSPIDAERSINCYEYHDPRGKKQKSLIGTSGFYNSEFVFGTETAGAHAQFVFNNQQYIVMGNTVFLLLATGSLTAIGSLPNANNNGYVGIDANTFQIIFVDGEHGYIYDTITGTYLQITDPAFPATPIDVCYLDGFFIVANGGTNQFELSSFNQGLVWGVDNTGTESTFTMAAASPNIVITFAAGFNINNYQIGTPIVFSGGALPAELVAGVTYYVKSIVSATTITVSATNGGATITSAAGGNGSLTNNGQLQLGSITTHPGTIVACRTLHRRLFLFSQFFTEVWENAGANGPLPFRRNNALLMEYGTPCIGSISVSFDTMCFLSQTRDGLGSVQQVNGTAAIPISTSALDAQLSAYASDATKNVTDCRAFLIKENNIIFYRMNFTKANHTFVYNISQSNPQSDEGKLWHEEEDINGNRHPAQTHAYYQGTNYVGSYIMPILYILDPQTFTNDGEIIHRTRITKAISPPGYQRIRVDRLQMDMLQGNVAQIESQFQALDLLTESLHTILTENGQNIILEQQQIISNPQELFVFLSISKDGGQTYGNIIRAPMGNVGQRTFRTVWRKLGVTKRGQAFVAKFEFYGTVPFVVMGGAWAMDTLPE